MPYFPSSLIEFSEKLVAVYETFQATLTSSGSFRSATYPWSTVSFNEPKLRLASLIPHNRNWNAIEDGDWSDRGRDGKKPVGLTPAAMNPVEAIGLYEEHETVEVAVLDSN